MSDSQENTLSSGFREKQVLVERYEILEEIGSGGLSTVYRAQDLVLNRVIAIKLLKSQSSEQYIVRLQREAKAICQLKHQSIIEVYDFFLADGNVPVLAMEYIKGESLDERIKRDGPMSQPAACAVFEQICNAISYAHDRHILHRDLKPGNVLVRTLDNGKFEVKIIDFGIAKLLDSEEGSLTGSGAVLGTPSYISPEQARGQEVDHRTDIYAFGCLMYKTLTGVAPFRGATAVDVVSAQINKEAPTLREGNESIEFAAEIELIVSKALKKDPVERFQTMHEVAQALRLLPTAQSIPPAESLVRETKGKRINWMLIFLVTLFLVLVGGIVYFIFQYDNSLDLEKARSDSQYDIRKGLNINVRYISKWKFLDIEGTVSDEQLKALPALNAERLDLSGSTISDEQLVHLVDLPLVTLDLRNTRISDKGIDTILRIKGLQSLLLEKCPKLGHEGYRKLAELKSLKILSLRNSNVSDQDLEYIAKLSELVLLYVSNSPNITDLASDQILKLEKLISVRIGGTKITAAGIEKLKAHRTLIFLGLDELNLSDEKMPTSFSENINMFDLSGNPVSLKGLGGVLAQPDLWYLDLRNCPNIDKAANSMLSNRLNVGEGRVLMTDITVRETEKFANPKEVEFYINPEHYKSRTLHPTEQRKKLIQENFDGPEL